MGRTKRIKIDRTNRVNLSSKDKDRIRKYEPIILSKDYTYNDRLILFHKVVSPLYGKFTEKLLYNGIKEEEIPSELYLISDKILKKYNPNKSSLVPYIERMLFWYLSQIKKDKIYYPLEFIEEYQLDEGFYYAAPNILFEEKYIGKLFTKEEKYIIYKLILLDKLSIRKLARELNISRESLIQIINNIKEKLNEV